MIKRVYENPGRTVAMELSVHCVWPIGGGDVTVYQKWAGIQGGDKLVFIDLDVEDEEQFIAELREAFAKARKYIAEYVAHCEADSKREQQPDGMEGEF